MHTSDDLYPICSLLFDIKVITQCAYLVSSSLLAFAKKDDVLQYKS